MFPKPTPNVIIKGERKAARQSVERRERKIVQLRSTGRCEVVVQTPKPEHSALIVHRCKAKAQHLHHLIAGSGRRGIGESALAPHMLHVCPRCHQLLHAKVLQAVDREWQYDAALVRFEAVPR